MIRALQQDDFEQIKKIHENFYEKEFSLPNFINNFLCGFTVLDDNNIIVSAGGIRTIAEVVLVTDKSRTVRERREALYQVLDAVSFVSGKTGYDQVHAFVTEPDWKKHLLRVGFNHCKGDALYLNV